MRPEPGSTLIVDIDGVISDASARQHFLDAAERDWWGFFNASVDDPPIYESLKLVNRLAEGHVIALLTARPEKLASTTLTWLDKNKIDWDLLFMRDDDDFRSSPDTKFDLLSKLRDVGYDPILAIDDDPRNLVMYRSEGIETVYVYSGYYE